jgi:hypothetical protein
MDAFTDQVFKQADGSDPALVITDSKGRPAAVDGVPVWASSDETVLRATPAADGMSAAVETVGPGGPARISVTADADLGSGVQTITGVSEDVTVTQNPNSMASVMTLNLGAPQDKP